MLMIFWIKIDRFDVDVWECNRVKIGEAAILGPLNDKRFVYYLITKENYFNKPTFEDVRV